MKKNVLFFVLFILCFVVVAIPLFAYADDTDVYNIAQDVRPNVLIIFDNSGSMADGIPYDDGTGYSGTYQPTTIYQRQCTNYSGWWCTQWGWVVYTGTFTDANLDGIHDSNNYIRKGNRLNYDTSTVGNKLAVAKTAIKNVIDETKDYVRFGVMVLNAQQNINGGATFPNYHNDNTVLSSNYGGAIIQDRTEAQITTLKNAIDNTTASGGTPLANRLIQAAKYYRGTLPKPGGGNYTSPIDSANWCRKNFVIIMTDGKPEGEGNNISANSNGDYDDIEDNFMDTNAGCRDCDGDGNDPDPTNRYNNGGSDYLDDVTKYLHDTNDPLDPGHAIQGNQNLTVYTIGFTIADQLLIDTATNGGGDYYTASNAEELAQALIQTLTTIIEGAQLFTAPVVPVQRTTSGDKIYLSLFSPKSDKAFWPGYLLKLNINSNGVILGYSNGYGTGDLTTIVDEDGNIYPNILNPLAPPYPLWDAHYVLKQRDYALYPRKIYTFLGNPALAHTSNTFNTTNINATMLGNPTKGTTPVTDLINYLYGLDAYDEDGDGNTAEKKEYILGDILHSKPLVIDYSSTKRVIFVGTNDGMLHAFNDEDGSEKWAFIPPDLLPKLKNMTDGTTHNYYVDGSCHTYIKDVNKDGNINSVDGDRVIIIFGERMGGTSYCALDVTDPDDPQFLWRIDNTVPGFEELGQSWSDPVLGKVKVDTTPTIVAFIGGGYNADSPNTKGRGLFIINVLTGAKVKGFTYSLSDPVLSNMTYCIPSMVAAVDTIGDNYINRVYVGDTGGQMWRFALHRENNGDTRAEDGNVNNWSARLLFQAGSGRKIFYRPDLALEYGYNYLYFGTGDRNNPGETAVTNRFYAVKDKNQTKAAFTTTLSESNLVNLTSNVLQDNPSSQSAIDALVALNAGDGWYIILNENSGEKVLAAPTVFGGVVLFETFAPNTDVCSYGGTGRVYAVNYLNATAVINFNESTEGLDKTDRRLTIGSGIPTEAVIFISGGGIKVRPRWLVGTGGGLGGAAGGDAVSPSCTGPDCSCTGGTCICTGPRCCTGIASCCSCDANSCTCTCHDPAKCCIGQGCCIGKNCLPSDAKLFFGDGWKGF